MNKYSYFMVFVFVLFSVLAIQAAELAKPAPDFTLTDADGKSYKLSDFRGKHVVLEWVNYGCPFVKKHYKSGNMQSLQKKYTEKGIVWLSVCSSAEGKQGYFSNEKINNLKEEYSAAYTAYLADTSGEVGKMYEAKTTPHMYVIDPKGILIYAGAIDDKKSTNTDDVKTAKNYISTILDDCLAGKEVEPTATTSYGCSVKYK